MNDSYHSEEWRTAVRAIQDRAGGVHQQNDLRRYHMTLQLALTYIGAAWLAVQMVKLAEKLGA